MKTIRQVMCAGVALVATGLQAEQSEVIGFYRLRLEVGVHQVQSWLDPFPLEAGEDCAALQAAWPEHEVASDGEMCEVRPNLGEDFATWLRDGDSIEVVTEDAAATTAPTPVRAGQTYLIYVAEPRELMLFGRVEWEREP